MAHDGGAFCGYVSGTVNITDNAAHDVIAAPGPGRRIIVTRVTVTNFHTSTSTKVAIRDGTTSKQSNAAVFGGGGWSQGDGFAPLFPGSVNAAITAICSVTGTDVDVSISGYILGTP